MYNVGFTILMAVLCDLTFAMPNIPKINTSPEVYTLKNGITVIVLEDHRNPAVDVGFSYRVGSIDDPGGLTGISHYLEHVMFLGTPKISKQHFRDEVTKITKSYNAYTTDEQTVYEFTTTPTHLKRIFELQADRAQQLLFKRDLIENERKVVLEERAMRVDNNPWGAIYEKKTAITNISSGYHHPVIGWKHDILSITREDLINWYQTWYTGDNLTILVVGDVESKKVLALSQSYFGNLRKTFPRKRRNQIETMYIPEVRAEIEARIKHPAFSISFKIPPFTQQTLKQECVFDILSILLGSADGILTKRMVDEDHMFDNFSALVHNNHWISGTFEFSGTPNKNIHFYSFKGNLLHYLSQFSEKNINKKQLQSIKNSLKASNVFNHDYLSFSARELIWLNNGRINLKRYDDLNSVLDDITPKDIAETVKSYFVTHPERIMVSVKPYA